MYKIKILHNLYATGFYLLYFQVSTTMTKEKCKVPTHKVASTSKQIKTKHNPMNMKSRLLFHYKNKKSYKQIVKPPNNRSIHHLIYYSFR